jgi:SAM-dependent methyltransferase
MSVERPAHLSAHNAAAFQLRDVVDAYHLRTPYPSTLTPFLLSLARPPGGAVLELGCGTGEIARRLAPHCERVDAVDVSAPMLARARSMPGGDYPGIRWIESRAESVELAPPYALAVAGDSLHWMTWEIVLPRVAAALSEGAHLAVVQSVPVDQPWSAELRDLFATYSVIRDFSNTDLIDELRSRGLFESVGDLALDEEPFVRSVEEYIESLHATSGLPRERMGDGAAEEFDRAVRALVAPHASDGVLTLQGSARIRWGVPLAPAGG